jgi:choice-of-anchor C domain-containing protein
LYVAIQLKETMMLMHNTLIATAFVMAWFATTSRVYSDNLVQNGGFETPVVRPTPDPILIVQAGGSFGAWKVGGVNVDVIHSSYLKSAEGMQSIDISGTAAGSISQMLSTVPGQTYTLRFAFTGNPDYLPEKPSPAIKQIKVLWEDRLVDEPTFDTTGHDVTDPGWSYRTYSVTATSDSTELKFVSLTPGCTGPLLDDVSVVASEPAPSSKPSADVSKTPGSVSDTAGGDPSGWMIAGMLCAAVGGLLLGITITAVFFLSRRRPGQG